ncbi:IS3 family transposase [Streptosporangium album]|uniref:IS3 family transposase n=1 Tax=Streptosporangium album TaxID=47479 RepID=UPI0016074FA4
MNSSRRRSPGSTRTTTPAYGFRKIHRQLRRDGHPVARCTVQRLMGELGIFGLVRGKARRRSGGSCIKALHLGRRHQGQSSRE